MYDATIAGADGGLGAFDEPEDDCLRDVGRKMRHVMVENVADVGSEAIDEAVGFGYIEVVVSVDEDERLYDGHDLTGSARALQHTRKGGKGGWTAVQKYLVWRQRQRWRRLAAWAGRRLERAQARSCDEGAGQKRKGAEGRGAKKTEHGGQKSGGGRLNGGWMWSGLEGGVLEAAAVDSDARCLFARSFSRWRLCRSRARRRLRSSGDSTGTGMAAGADSFISGASDGLARG
ncbi:hypothetical protein FGB62_4g250 [Gracilaria domingensis]|nr:hypothetical protein FGB62_4g250 [Gracilaria domingensis]